MTSKKIITAGIGAGIVFYVVSLVVWGLFKFLPVVPLPLALQQQGLQSGWLIEHLLVSLFIGLLWGYGYSVYGKVRAGGWLYGGTIYLVGLLPVFVAQFIILAPIRMLTVYGAVISLIGALLAGKVISLIAKK